MESSGRDKLKMVMTKEGRLRPAGTIPLDTITLQTINDTCPGNQIHGLPSHLHEPETEIDDVWGPLIQLNRGYPAGVIS